MNEMPKGPDDASQFSPLEQRVGRLEEDMREVKASLKDIQNGLRSIKTSLAEIKGKISQSRTWLQLIIAIIATWGAGAALVAP